MTEIIRTQAPARVCLFGDHQDYLKLPIIACAIDKHIQLEATKQERLEFKIEFLDIHKTRTIPYSVNFDQVPPEDFLLTALKVALRKGKFPAHGYDIKITGNVPMNAGLSSSSALVVGWSHFLTQALHIPNTTAASVAHLAYSAEVLEHGNPGGKMDQYSSSLGNIIYLETGEEDYFETIGTELDGLVVGESGVPKDTWGLLSSLKDGAMESVDYLTEKQPNFQLQNVNEQNYADYEGQLPEKLRPLFYAAVHNHIITQKAHKAFTSTTVDLMEIGSLMNAHHAILRDILKITVPRIDNMINAALEAGALGAKIVGSGGGGCIVAIAPNNQEKVATAMRQAGAVNAYAVKVSKGVI